MAIDETFAALPELKEIPSTSTGNGDCPLNVIVLAPDVEIDAPVVADVGGTGVFATHKIRPRVVPELLPLVIEATLVVVSTFSDAT